MRKEIKYREGTTRSTLGELIDLAYRERKVPYLVGQFLDITQVYLDRLMVPVEGNSQNPPNYNSNPQKERENLENLLSADLQLVLSLRLKQKIDIPKTKYILGELYKEPDKNDGAFRSKPRYLEEEDNKKDSKCMEALYKNLLSSLPYKKIDAIVYIANGALESALLVKAIKPGADLIPVRYSTYRERDKSPCLPRFLEPTEFQMKIRDKSILIIDDDIDSGRTMSNVLKWLSKFEPGELYFGAAFAKRITKYPDLGSISDKLDVIFFDAIFEGLAGPSLYRYNYKNLKG